MQKSLIQGVFLLLFSYIFIFAALFSFDFPCLPYEISALTFVDKI